VVKKPSYEELEQRVKELEAALGDSELERTTILDLQPYHSLIQSLDNRIIWANRAAFESVGVSREDLIGRYCYEIWPQQTCPCPDCPVIKSVQTGKPQSIEKTTPDGRKWHIRGYPIRNNRGLITRALEVTEEITERKQTEEALRESEEKYRDLYDNAPDMFVSVDSKTANIIECNQTLANALGYTKEEIIGRPIFDMYTPDSAEYAKLNVFPVFVKTGKIIGEEFQLQRKDGSALDVSLNVSAVRDEKGDIIRSRSVWRDITERKRAEEQIHALTQELMRAQESERQRISRELHDRVAQELSALKIGYETLFDNQPAIPPKIRQRVSEMSKTLRECIKEVRDISYDLRPPVLDELGLVQTLSQYCNDFSKNNGTNVDFHSAGMKDLKLDFDTEINLYRLIQEGLTNIKKHADADYVTVRLVAAFPNIILRIEDNGRGFDVHERLTTITKEKRMGIRSMEERVKLLKGKMEIQSKPNQGTKISIKFPYKGKKRGEK